jgi:hypothetical protein
MAPNTEKFCKFCRRRDIHTPKYRIDPKRVPGRKYRGHLRHIIRAPDKWADLDKGINSFNAKQAFTCAFCEENPRLLVSGLLS